MLYAGIDYHKRYSQVNVIDEKGRKQASARLPNDLACIRRPVETSFTSTNR
jgi:hypothetical protein